MKKVINFRPLFFILLGLIAGVLGFTFLTMTSATEAVVFGWILVGLLGVILGLFVLSLTVSKATGFFAWLKTQKWTLGILLTATVFGSCLMGANWLYYNSIPNLNSTYEITGNVSYLSAEKSTYTILVLDHVTATDSEGSTSVFGNVNCYVYETGILGSLVDHESSITFTGTLQKIAFENVGYALSQYANRTIYSAFLSDDDMSVTKSGSKLSETILVAYGELLHEHLPSETANLSFSLLFGGDDLLEEEILNLFSTTGIIHIISVSGLHVAVLMVGLLGLLKLLRVPKKAHIWVLAFTLTFYAYLCGFVPSVVRSVIMGLVFLLASRLGQQYDPLSALSFSGIVILLFAPLQLFTLGFQLSFVCIFAMITLAPVVTKALVAIGLPRGVAQTFSLTGCITLLTAPLVAFAFYQLPVYSIFSNLLVVPLLSLAFILLLVFSTLGLLIAPLGFLLIVPQVLLHFSMLLLGILAQLPASIIGVYSDGYLSLLGLLCVAFLVRFVQIKFRFKAMICCLLVLLVTASTIFYNVPKTIYENALWCNYQQSSTVSLLTTSEGKHILLGQSWQPDDVLELKHWLKVNQIDAVVAYDFSFQNQEQLVKLCRDYHVEKLFIFIEDETLSESISETFSFANVEIFHTTSQFVYANVSFRAMMESRVIGLQITIENSNILVLQPDQTRLELIELSMFTLPHFEWIMVANTYQSIYNYGIVADQVVCQKNAGNWSHVRVIAEEKLCKISL